MATRQGIQALVFDCDGTIVDTMPFFYWENHQAARDHGIELTEETFYRLAGRPIKELLADVAAQQGVQVDMERLMASKAKYREINPTPITAIAPVERIIRQAVGMMPMAVASSGLKASVTSHLKEVGLYDLFDAIVTVEDVENGKPAPDLFLLAAEKIGVAPEHCRGFEDADLGIVALKAAGMEVVDVRLMEGYPHCATTAAAAAAAAATGYTVPAL